MEGSSNAIRPLSAMISLSETGNDMTQFESNQQLVLWVGLSPANNVNAGEKKLVRFAKTEPYLESSANTYSTRFIRHKAEDFLFRRTALHYVYSSFFSVIFLNFRDLSLSRAFLCFYPFLFTLAFSSFAIVPLYVCDRRDRLTCLRRR